LVSVPVNSTVAPAALASMVPAFTPPVSASNTPPVTSNVAVAPVVMLSTVTADAAVTV
jgi:hypothetical protein